MIQFQGEHDEVVACSLGVSDKIGHRYIVLAAFGFGVLIQCRRNSQVLIRVLFMELGGLVLFGAWGAGTSHPSPPPLPPYTPIQTLVILLPPLCGAFPL